MYQHARQSYGVFDLKQDPFFDEDLSACDEDIRTCEDEHAMKTRWVMHLIHQEFDVVREVWLSEQPGGPFDLAETRQVLENAKEAVE